MSELPGEDEMAAAVPLEDLRALRILQGALTVGPLLFLTIALGLPFRVPPGAAAPPPVLLAALAFVTLGAWTGAAVLPAARYRALARSLREAPPADAGGALSAWINEVRGARILSLALLEGAALFGLVVLFMHRAAGVEPAGRPELWGTLVPLLGFVVYSAGTWPSARSIASGWRRYVLEGV